MLCVLEREGESILECMFSVFSFSFFCNKIAWGELGGAINALDHHPETRKMKVCVDWGGGWGVGVDETVV